jgi:hypothetical protein
MPPFFEFTDDPASFLLRNPVYKKKPLKMIVFMLNYPGQDAVNFQCKGPALFVPRLDPH